MSDYDWLADEPGGCPESEPDPCDHGFAMDEHCPECDGPVEPSSEGEAGAR